MQKRLAPEIKPDPIVPTRGASLQPRVLSGHPLGGRVFNALLARGGDYRRVPARWDAPCGCPLVDRLDVCADRLCQDLAGRPGVDQGANGDVFLGHTPIFWTFLPVVKSGRYFDWRKVHEAQDWRMEESAKPEAFDFALVAPRLEAVRAALKLSKAEMAEVIEIDPSSYSKIIKGEKPLLPPQAWNLWHKYAVDLNFLYLGQIGGLPSYLSKAVMTHLTGAQE